MKPYKISVGSAEEYEELIAEILFPKKFGLLISQEKGEGNFEVSVHSFKDSASDNFDYNRNVDADKVSLSALTSAISEGVSELERLARKPK